MWRTLVAGVVGCLTLVGQTPDGEAPTVDEVAAAIAQDGWYAHPDAVGDREQLAMLAERLDAGGERMGFALLAAEPPGSSPQFAEDVLDVIIDTTTAEIETVVVLSDADVGVVSDEWSDRSIDEALDETIDEIRANRTDGIEALADALADGPSDFGSGFDDEEDSSDGGGSDNSNTGLLIVGLVVLIGGSYIWKYMTGGEFVDEDYDGSSSSSSSSSWSRRRSSFSRSSRRSSSSSSSSRRSSSRSSSGRGRGGRRL